VANLYKCMLFRLLESIGLLLRASRVEWLEAIMA